MQQKAWSILFAVVNLAAFGLFAVAPFVGWWLPANIGPFGDCDTLFYVILAVTGLFFVLTEGVLIYNMYVYTADPARKPVYTHGNHKLEMLWTAVPAVLLLLLAFVQVPAWGFAKYVARMPNPDQVFEVSARQFEWRVRYPTTKQLDDMTAGWRNGKETAAAAEWSRNRHFDDVHRVNEVHVWKGGKVRLYLKTQDVLHSFFLPHVRIKQDAVPGKVIPVWFEANESNTAFNAARNTWEMDENKNWELACAELCGWGHYKMQGRLYVHPDKADFEKWLQHAAAEQEQTKP